ncbi:MAG: complex I subunit 4 family protein [Candidatus Dormibacteria bacterium]
MSFLAQTSTTTGATFPTIICTCLVWIALIFALVALVMPDTTHEQRSRIKSLGASGAGAALFFAVWALESQIADVALGSGGFPGGDLVERHQWILNFPIQASYHLDLDGMGVALVTLFGVVFFCAALAAWRNDRHVKLLTVSLLTMETAAMGVLCSYQWILFLFFWALPVIPVYLLIRAFGRGQHAGIADRYAAGLLVSWGLLALAAILMAFQAGVHFFDMGDVPVLLHGDGQGVVFWMVAGAALLTMAIVPFHGALLDLEEDSTGVLAAVFATVVPSLGAYVLLHVAMGFFPTVGPHFSLLFAAVAVATVIWAGLAALRADDLRRQVGHVGTVMMGVVLLGVAGHSSVAVTGIMFLLIARGLVMTVLMLLVSAVHERTRRVRISQLGGLAWQAPYLCAFWVLATLTAAGLPLLAGFSGDFLIFTGSFPAHRWATAVVLAATLLVGGVLLWTVQRIFFGASRETFERVRDIGPLELTYLGILVAAIVLVGVLPGHFAGLFENGAGYILFPGTAG